MPARLEVPRERRHRPRGLVAFAVAFAVAVTVHDCRTKNLNLESSMPHKAAMRPVMCITALVGYCDTEQLSEDET